MADKWTGIKKRWLAWLDKRIPAASSIQLSHRSIFIFPSKMGFLFLALLGIIFILAVNFQNSLAYGLLFLLGSILFVGIYHTYQNLSKLQLIATPVAPCFVGDTLKFKVLLKPLLGKEYFQIKLGWEKSKVVDVPKDTESVAELEQRAVTRGLYNPKRMRISTTFPLGLLEAWSWVALRYEAIVYPKPIREPFQYVSGAIDNSQPGRNSQKGMDDFHGFRKYQPGDNLKQVAWKQFARGQGMLTKEFEDHFEHSHWLDFNATKGDIEKRLSILCGWILMSHEAGYEYGIRLPGCEIEPSRGDSHRDQCLRALAVYPGAHR